MGTSPTKVLRLCNCERHVAGFTEAVDKYGQTFRLLNAPVAFPTR